MPPVSNQSKDFITELQQISSRQGLRQPASSILSNMEAAATISKFVRPREVMQNRPSDPNTGMVGVNNGIDVVSRSIMGRVEDNENVFKLFPDIELAAQIVISSILSPKDMVKADLIYRLKDSRFPPEMTAKIIAYIKDNIEKDYKIQDELAIILRSALFQSGSYVKAVLPEAAVDQLINGQNRITTESIISSDLFLNKNPMKLKNIGYLGDPRVKEEKQGFIFALERASSGAPTLMYEANYYPGEKEAQVDEDIDISKLNALMVSCIEVSDNYQFLKMPKLIDRVNGQTVANFNPSSLKSRVLKFATEHAELIAPEHKPSKNELGNMIYKSPSTRFLPFVNLPTKENLYRRSVGKPMVLKLPSEAAIPVHVPGNPEDHVGYFVPCDMDGNPISFGSISSEPGGGLASILQHDKQGSGAAGILTDKAKRNLVNDGVVPTIDRLADIYADLIENDLLERLLKGSYGKKLQVSRSTEISRIMLARTLKSQSTRLIYVPAEYITYFAFNYHRNGVGKSYLDDLSNITSLRAMVLFSKVMAKVKSSITTTAVDITLDPRDPDPVKTIESAKHLIAKARQQYFPHGLNRVVDLTDWIQRAGIEITFQGHPRLPNTKFEFESKNIQHTEPDDNLEEMFRHQTYMHFGLSPETVDAAAKADFATTIQMNSILFARRIYMLSNTFSAKLTEYAQKILNNDETLQAGIVEIFKEFKDSIEKLMDDEEKSVYEKDPVGLTTYLLQAIIDLVELDLPKPDSTRNESLKTEISAYSGIVDEGLKYIFSSDILPAEFAGRSAEYVEAIKTTWKASLMRRWMAENNYAPELFEITNRNEDGQPMANLLEQTKGYAENVLLNVTGFLKAVKLPMLAADLDINKITGGEEAPAGSSSSSDMGYSDTGTPDFSTDFGDQGTGEEEIPPEKPVELTEPAAEEEAPALKPGEEEEKPDETKV